MSKPHFDALEGLFWKPGRQNVRELADATLAVAAAKIANSRMVMCEVGVGEGYFESLVVSLPATNRLGETCGTNQRL